MKYESIGDELIISGDGEITKEGVRSKGNFNSVKSIKINEGPTAILEGSFWECFSLESLSIPASVTRIYTAFFRNNKLSNIRVSGTNPSYFTDSQGILYDKGQKVIFRIPTKPVTIPEGVTTISKYAFSSNQVYQWNIVFPSSIQNFELDSLNEAYFTSLSFNANPQVTELRGFGWSHFEKLKIPDSCQIICENTFFGSIIDEISFGPLSSLTTIDSNAFVETVIVSITLPNSLLTIKCNAFQLCRKLYYVSVGVSCQTIDRNAFMGCGELKQIVIPPGNPNFKTVGNLVMNKQQTQIVFIQGECTQLEIPSTVQTIGCNLLQMQSNLKQVYFPNSPYFSASNGIVYSKNYRKVMFICGGVDTALVSEIVESVEENAAAFCHKLYRFVFAGAICNKIDNLAFLNSGLQEFVLPDTVTYIGTNAFMDCFDLNQFTISANSVLETIEAFAFQSTHFSEIFIPSRVSVIKDRAFHQANLTSVTFHGSCVLKTLDPRVFLLSTIERITFANSLETIKEECFHWCLNLTSVSFDMQSNLRSISENAFKGCESLTSVNLPTNCHTIGDNCFSGCYSLQTFNYVSLRNIGSLCFSQCISLKSFHIQPSLEEIKANTFTGCISLIEFTIGGHNTLSVVDGVVFNKEGKLLYLYPPGREEAKISNVVLEFRENAFSGCTILKDLIFASGNAMRRFEVASFYGCVSLKNILFPPFLETIGEDCFRGCESIEYIILPTGMQTIGTNAFCGCTSLKVVKYCGTSPVNGEKVFPSSLGPILVTKFYPEDQLCSHGIEKKLKANCEYDAVQSIALCTPILPKVFLYLAIVCAF